MDLHHLYTMSTLTMSTSFCITGHRCHGQKFAHHDIRTTQEDTYGHQYYDTPHGRSDDCKLNALSLHFLQMFTIVGKKTNHCACCGFTPQSQILVLLVCIALLICRHIPRRYGEVPWLLVMQTSSAKSRRLLQDFWHFETDAVYNVLHEVAYDTFCLVKLEKLEYSSVSCQSDVDATNASHISMWPGIQTYYISTGGACETSFPNTTATYPIQCAFVMEYMKVR